MPILTVRPNVSIQDGTWSKVPSATAMHTILADNSDSTYIQNANKCRLPTQMAKLGITDISLPAGAKIFSVRTRIRTERITGFTVQPLCILIFVQKVVQAAFTLNIVRIIQLVFSFLTPRRPTTGWETSDLAYYTEAPAGGEWTQQSFNDFEVHLGRELQGGNLKISELYVEVDYNERPVATATGPTGTVNNTTRPTITWTYTDPESDRQQSYRVRIFSAAQYTAPGFDPLISTPFVESGWVRGEDLSWVVPRDLVNGAWRAYVDVEQVWAGIGNHRSVQSFVSWTQSVPGPGAPVLNGTYETALNRVRLDIAAGPAPATETYDVEYSDDAGLTWAYVRGGRQIVPDGAGSATLYDYEARLNRVRRYRVLAFRTLGSVKVASMYSNTVDVTPRSFSFWLKDPLSPSLNMVLPLGNDEFAQPRSEGVFKPLVADDREARAVVVSGPIYGREGSWELLFPAKTRHVRWDDGQTAWEKFAAIRRSGRVLLWQLPTGEQHYVALTGELPTTWRPRPRDDEAQWRRASIGYIEVDPPKDATT